MVGKNPELEIEVCSAGLLEKVTISSDPGRL
jgi:hypothetical protein